MSCDTDAIEASLPMGKVLRYYARREMLADIQRLVVVGADGILRGEAGRCVNDQDESGYTALHLAAFENYSDIVAWFCHIGVNLNLTTRGGDTPLYLAGKPSLYSAPAKLWPAN